MTHPADVDVLEEFEVAPPETARQVGPALTVGACLFGAIGFLLAVWVFLS